MGSDKEGIVMVEMAKDVEEQTIPLSSSTEDANEHEKTKQRRQQDVQARNCRQTET